LLCHLLGAEAAVVVNNNAAATLLTLAATAAGPRSDRLARRAGGDRRRIPRARRDGAIRRHPARSRAPPTAPAPADYAAAIGERTAAILRVHPSNFRIEGFAARPDLADLVALAQRFNLPMIEDIGSGWIGELPPPAALGDEPAPRSSIAAGADAVLFSADKLLGGPQAGIIAGRAALSEAVRRHPLMRAVRVDKMTYAALEATLQEYAAGRAAETDPGGADAGSRRRRNPSPRAGDDRRTARRRRR
jgi:L-seryl-tRNA(Ser) seleniumtransferase